MPAIGRLERIGISQLTAVDEEEEMSRTHMRFTDDVMGSPRFNGIRFDAAEGHPIEDVTLSDIRYVAVGGVKLADIPPMDQYPPVLDRLVHPNGVSSENYYPDWSRATFMDLRNVHGITLRGLHFTALRDDEREPVIIEGCTKAREVVF